MFNKIFQRQRLLRGAARMMSPALKLVEPRLYRQVEKTESDHCPIFIIGAPRTGSTVLYQMLTNWLDCLYIDNLVYAFSNDLPFGFWLSQRMFGSTPHNSFESTFGNTPTLHSPSEGGAFWYRWFPREYDFVEAGELSERSVQQMRASIYSVMNRYQKSIVIKNLNAGQRIRVLKEVFPKGKFVFIRRDPFFTIQSLLKARETQAMDPERWWSVKPRNYRELQDMSYIDRIVGQVFYLEKQIVEDTEGLADDRVFKISYSRYAEQFMELISFLNLPQTQDVDWEGFRFSNKVSVDPRMHDQISRAMQAYNWKELGYE